MVNPVGPVFTGGFEEFVVDDASGEQYTILYLPDLNNDALQAERKPPVFYWAPGSVRLARKGDAGDYKFHHTHFVGVLDEQTHIGVEGNAEVVGGVLAFTITARYPTQALQRAHEQLLNKYSGRDQRYWGIRTNAAPEFRIVPITKNTTAITNLTPGADGTAPAENIPPTPAAPGGNGQQPAPGAAPRSLVRRAELEGPVAHGARFQPRSNLDAWAWELQGQGPGSVTGGENAYAGLIGAYPSEIVWAGFHGAYSPIAVTQHLVMPMWSQEIYLKITGNWDRIFQHFSAHAQGRYAWFSGDIKAEFNQLRITGGIEVEVMVDGTTPEGKEMEEAINKRIDLITEKFMEQATQRIFAPAPPDVKPAESSSGGLFSSLFGYGGGLALKYRRDEQHLNLNYEETRYFRYNQTNTISSTFEGFFNAIKDDPEAERKYFTRLVLGDLSRKVTRIVKPVVNWPDPGRRWVGEPVAFLSASLGYPTGDGSLETKAHVFQSTDTGDQTSWNEAFARRNTNEVQNPPEGWEPDKLYVKRKVHLQEPPGVTDYPYTRVMVERNEIDLDPGERGALSSEAVLEVRADSVGKLELGPITIDLLLEDPKQIVEVEFKALGRSLDGQERPVVRFAWQHSDQNEPRYYEIFTGDLNYVPDYQYRVICTVKGTFTTRGMSWTGPWADGSGNGPLMVRVPLPDEPGVVQHRMTPRDIAVAEPTPTPITVVPTDGDGQVGGRPLPPPPPQPRPVEAPVGSGAPGPGRPAAAKPPSGPRKDREAPAEKRYTEPAEPVMVRGWEIDRHSPSVQ